MPRPWYRPPRGLLLLLACLALLPRALRSDSLSERLLPPESPRAAEWVFSRSYYDPGVHQLAECGSNVWRLLSQMSRAGVDLSEARVLYLFRMKGHDELLTPASLRRLHPSRARFGMGGLSVPWVFHVCLEYRGRILDLDYGHSPQIVSARHYFASMFPSELSELSVRSIPAKDYLREYDARDPSRNWQYYLAGGGKRFPILTSVALYR